MHANFQQSSALCKGNIFKFWVVWRGGKKVHFQRKTGLISETVRDMVKVSINH